MSANFERWKELAVLISKEKDPERLPKLASEMNLALAQNIVSLPRKQGTNQPRSMLTSGKGFFRADELPETPR
jgi:hypothetical protein